MTEYFGLNAADVALLVGMFQCGLIAWGIRAMSEGNKGRDVLLEAVKDQSAGLREQTASLRATTLGIEKLLERNA